MKTKVSQSPHRGLYNSLGTLLTLVAVNAFGGGIYGMAGAENVPAEWLDGSPFTDYFIPSLFLFTVIGGTTSLSAAAAFMRHRLARKAAFFSGMIILLWLVIQVSVIGYVSWMQPATAIAALAILALGWLVPEERL